MASVRRNSAAVWSGFAALCLASGSLWIMQGEGGVGWLADASQPGMLALGGVILLLRRRGTHPSLGFSLKIVGLTLCFAGIPAIIDALMARSVGEMNRTAAIGLVPVFVVFFCAIESEGMGGSADLPRSLVPCLLGLGGLMLVLPVSLPSSGPAEWRLAVFCLSGILQAWAAVRLNRVLRGTDLGWGLGLVLVTQSVASVIAGEVSARYDGTATAKSGVIVSLVLGAAFMLVAWLLREMHPVQLAGRFLAMPLVTILEGVALLRPQVTLRLVAGIMMLAAGMWGLVAAGRCKEPEGLRLS